MSTKPASAYLAASTMQFASLGSGSKGNATVISAGDQLILVDCGFSLKETTKRLARLTLKPEQLTAILVTHEHSDHSSGVARLSARYGIPIYLSHGSYNSGRCNGGHSVSCFNSGAGFELGDVHVQSVPVPHDAREPCQFRINWGDKSLGILTDLGSITPHIIETYQDCDALLMEFNHDELMLREGAYPPQLKRRVSGDWGHLNNNQAAELLGQLSSPRLKRVVVAHISEKNNCRSKAEDALKSVWQALDRVVWAEQQLGCEWLSV